MTTTYFHASNLGLLFGRPRDVGRSEEADDVKEGELVDAVENDTEDEEADVDEAHIVQDTVSDEFAANEA
jgi:hypothetical protein